MRKLFFYPLLLIVLSFLTPELLLRFVLRYVIFSIGTSQESSDEDTIKQMAIRNKICGVDIQHIGDAGYSGLAPVENIFALSKAIRGNRHSIAMIARSVNR